MLSEQPADEYVIEVIREKKGVEVTEFITTKQMKDLWMLTFRYGIGPSVKRVRIYDPVDWDGFRYFREIVYASFQYGSERCNDPTDLNPTGKETPDVASP